MSQTTRDIVVGVVDERSRHVVETAAWYADTFGARLTCVAVDASPYTLGETPTGGLVTVPPLAEDLEFDPALSRIIDEVVAPRGIAWTPRPRVGGPATEISRVAEELDALMIVVGTKEGPRGSPRELFNGSVAAQLTHRQRRPVVVVPLDPVGEGVDPIQDGPGTAPEPGADPGASETA